MSKVRTKASPQRYESAAEWPAWTDVDFWEPTEVTGPSEVDDTEHASWNHTWHDEDGPAPDDPIWDEWAEEAANRDEMSRGNRPF